MDKKAFQEIKNKPVNELQATLKELKDKLWQLKVDLVSGKVKNIKEIKEIKRDIARILTTINQKNG